MTRRTKGQGRYTPPKPKAPPKQYGVDVDRVGGEIIVTATEAHAVVSLIWKVQDAVHIAEMILAAADEGGKDRSMEVVRESGIVVAKELP